MNYNLSIAVIYELIKMFTTWQIEVASKAIEFNKRNRGLTAVAFFKAFTIGIWNAHDITLDIIAGKCEEFQYGLILTKQSLMNRLKVGSLLMKELLGIVSSYALKNSFSCKTIEVLKQSRDVYVCDSTTISLPVADNRIKIRQLLLVIP